MCLERPFRQGLVLLSFPKNYSTDNVFDRSCKGAVLLLTGSGLKAGVSLPTDNKFCKMKRLKLYAVSAFCSLLFSCVRQQCNRTCTFNSYCEFTLMFSANTGYTARKNFSSFRRETTEFSRIFVIDFFDMIYAEVANFSSGSSRTISSHYIIPPSIGFEGMYLTLERDFFVRLAA